MQIITKTLLCFMLLCVVQFSFAQKDNSDEIEALKAQKEVVKEEEKARLKEAVEAINKRLENEEITLDQATKLKK